MTNSNENIVGSGRSQGEKNIGQLMMTAAEKGIIIKGGGHAKACGFTLTEDKVEDFKKFLIDETDDIKINNEKYFESQIDLNIINEKLIKDLNLLSPYGQHNPEPIFKCESVKIDIIEVFKEKHAKLKFSDNLDFMCEGMFFDVDVNELKDYLSRNSNFDCYFKVKKDTYSNKTIIHLEDIH